MKTNKRDFHRSAACRIQDSGGTEQRPVGMARCGVQPPKSLEFRQTSGGTFLKGHSCGLRNGLLEQSIGVDFTASFLSFIFNCKKSVVGIE